MVRRKPQSSWFGSLLHPGVLFGSLAVAILLCVVAYAAAGLGKASSQGNVPATAVLNIIPAPTATYLTEGQSPEASPTSPSGLPPAPQSGEIGIGAYVQVTNTGGEGLRLRLEPGLGGQVLMLGSEAEVFRVLDGPRELDGYTWWLLVGPFDESRKGWGVSNYLVVVQNP